jgi:dihydroflavonol-4-reductase
VKVFITGATGFIGRHLARLLAERGFQVRALVRPSKESSRLAELGVEPLEGDLRDSTSVRRAMQGCRTGYHVAADYRLWVADPQEMYEANIAGTANVLDAARRCGMERLVYTSTVGALGIPKNGSPGTEATPVREKDMCGPYKHSKYLAEQVASRYASKGFPVVIVNPSTPVGPGDGKPTPTGKIILDFLKGKMPAYLDTGLNLVHVEDVAHGHILAMEKGRVGEKYILGNRNLMLKEIFHLLSKISGLPEPRVRLPFLPILGAAYMNEALSRWLTGKEPLIPLNGVRMAKRTMFFDGTKAVRELGVPQTPVRRALEEAVEWFEQNNYVR